VETSKASEQRQKNELKQQIQVRDYEVNGHKINRKYKRIICELFENTVHIVSPSSSPPTLHSDDILQ